MFIIIILILDIHTGLFSQLGARGAFNIYFPSSGLSLQECCEEGEAEWEGVGQGYPMTFMPSKDLDLNFLVQL